MTWYVSIFLHFQRYINKDLKADSQRVAMLQLQALTGLNFQWTMMCLEANGWDLALAKSNYDELISSTPVSKLRLRCASVLTTFSADDTTRGIRPSIMEHTLIIELLPEKNLIIVAYRRLLYSPFTLYVN